MVACVEMGHDAPNGLRLDGTGFDHGRSLLDPAYAHAHPREDPLSGGPKAWVTVSMSWAAGFVDAVSWLVLHCVYRSHMNGRCSEGQLEISEAYAVAISCHAFYVRVNSSTTDRRVADCAV